MKEAQASGIIDTDAGDTVYTLTLKLSDGGSHEVKLCEYLKGFNALYYGSGPSLYIKADALKLLIEGFLFIAYICSSNLIITCAENKYQSYFYCVKSVS